ncbi:MAG: hypothetical protein IKA61_05860 [Clostridia bacterium]|nr:hypothetical protein [Clostridia bacterium]
MNPFNEKPRPLIKLIQNWQQLYPKPYDKREVDPYTKTRIILMNGTEFEANWFSHNFARSVCDNDLRRELALTRDIEKQQQLKISLLKPKDESILEHTVSYEQLAVDLTAELAKRELDCDVKTALDFALLEDFDHLYRYANLLEGERGIAAEWLVGRYTEIMPGRPTISHHRHPFDNVKRCINAKTSDVQTVLSTMIITAAEQQTMNYYMNVTNFATTDIGRRLYQEIAMVEEEHVSHYESLMDANATPFEKLLWHEYCECYLYWSAYMTETDPYIKNLWEENLSIEISHLHKAVELLQRYEGKEWQEVIPCGDFPAPISLHENIDYVRKILSDTVQYTSLKDDYARVKALPDDADFFIYQSIVNPTTDIVPSHNVIEGMIRRRGADYRFQVAPSPIPELRNRREDNTSVGRKPNAASSTDFTCNKL